MSVRPSQPIAKSQDGEPIYLNPKWIEIPIEKPKLEEVLAHEFASSNIKDFVVENSTLSPLTNLPLADFLDYYES